MKRFWIMLLAVAMALVIALPAGAGKPNQSDLVCGVISLYRSWLAIGAGAENVSKATFGQILRFWHIGLLQCLVLAWVALL